MNTALLSALTVREVAARYRGSVLGLLWSLLIPLFLLGIYTFVFGFVFKSRWSAGPQSSSIGDYAIILFSGLIVFQVFAEVVNRALGLILANSNYVKKVVFPLEVLVPVALGSALFNLLVSLVVLLAAMLVTRHPVPLTALWLPIILLPYCLLVLGISWFLASLGVYIRDIGQVLGTVVTALMFLSPVFFPISNLPEWAQRLVMLNPVAVPVSLARDAVVFGLRPHLLVLGPYAAVALVVCALGYLFFQKTRKGFADVI
jgi:lipopolysaccharide transport system permease protein